MIATAKETETKPGVRLNGVKLTYSIGDMIRAGEYHLRVCGSPLGNSAVVLIQNGRVHERVRVISEDYGRAVAFAKACRLYPAMDALYVPNRGEDLNLKEVEASDKLLSALVENQYQHMKS